VSGLKAARTGATGGVGAAYPAQGMKRRDMMQLMSLVMLPMMRGRAMASRPGLNRDVPPGKESLSWVANSATLIYGEQDAVLVDTFLTVEQSNGWQTPLLRAERR
jgi:hypothetical protein